MHEVMAPNSNAVKWSNLSAVVKHGPRHLEHRWAAPRNPQPDIQLLPSVLHRVVLQVEVVGQTLTNVSSGHRPGFGWLWFECSTLLPTCQVVSAKLPPAEAELDRWWNTLILVYKGCMNLKTRGIPYYSQNFDSFYPLFFPHFSAFFHKIRGIP